MQPRRNWAGRAPTRRSAEHGERGDRALKLESLLEVSARAKDKAETHHAVENDHHRREHRVPGDALAALGPSEHDRDNEPGFDHRHRDREKDRAKRFAKLEREHLGVMDGGEHRRAEEETRENKDISIVGRDDMGQASAPTKRSRAAVQPRPRPEWRWGLATTSIHSVARTSSVQEKGDTGNPARRRRLVS